MVYNNHKSNFAIKMGWYGGQEGAARTRWHDQSRASYNRFQINFISEQGCRLETLSIIMSHAPSITI